LSEPYEQMKLITGFITAWLDGGVACFDGRRILDFIRELEGLPVERKKK